MHHNDTFSLVVVRFSFYDRDAYTQYACTLSCFLFAQSFYVITIKECASEVSFHFNKFGGTVYPTDAQHFSIPLVGPMQNKRTIKIGFDILHYFETYPSHSKYDNEFEYGQ